ncbi:MAG: RNA polymerase sigma factor [Planctomycetia bacterium]
MILARVADRRHDAMEECLAAYGGLVWSLAMRLSATREDAEEAAQEIFFDVWKHAGRFDPRLSSEATFIALIARRRLVDRHRRQACRPPSARLEENAEMPLAATDHPIDVQDEVEHVRRLMGLLRAEERQVLELALGEGCSQADISTRTGMPLGTVKSHARRGLASLRALAEQASSGEDRSRESGSREAKTT